MRHTASPQTFSYRPEGEQVLWAHVLLTQVRDLCARHGEFHARRDAERWVGDYPSVDFRAVVSLAGLDPQAVWERLHAMRALPVDERPWLVDIAHTVDRERRKSRHAQAEADPRARVAPRARFA